MRIETKVTQVGLDNHRNFSRLTGRDISGKIVLRQRLEHKDRQALRADLRRFPSGIPVVLEGTFGWGWMSDELRACDLDPHLASGRKIAAWREARGMAKNNKLDADLLSELWSQPERWWEVWLAPPEVRDQREWLRYRMSLVRTQTALKNRIHAWVFETAGPGASAGGAGDADDSQDRERQRGSRAMAQLAGGVVGAGLHDPGGGGVLGAFCQSSEAGGLRTAGAA